MKIEASMARHTCLKLHLQQSDDAVFVKAAWFPSRFHLAISDGLSAWTCHASEGEVRLRAEQWDLSVDEYIALSERYLGFQQPHSSYAFDDAGNGHRRLTWTFEKQGTKLEWRWKCQPSPDNKQTTAEILDFLMDANIRLSEEVVRKTQSSEKLKIEAQKCLAQSESFKNEKAAFELEVYSKFVQVLNSKKAKLRELRDRISKLEATGNASDEDGDSTDKTESFHGGSDEDIIKEEFDEETAVSLPTTSNKNVGSSSTGRKRRTRKQFN